MANKFFHDNISYVATQRTEYRREAMSRQKTTCHDRKWKNETKKVNVAIRFFSWMSTPGRICCNTEDLVAIKETRRKQKFCRNKASSVATIN